MTQEDKELLLKDLCARLPYGVKVVIEFSKDKYSHVYDLREIDNDSTAELRQQVTVWNYGFYSSVISCPLIDCRPYLRPMSSMTDEEKKEFIYCAEYDVEESANGRHYEYYLKDYVGTTEKPMCNCNAIDWLNAHHFDYRGLIPNLALEAPEGMYK